MNINISIEQLGLSVEDQIAPKIVGALRASMNATLTVVKNKWQKEAAKKLNSTREAYLGGIDEAPNLMIAFPYRGDPFTGAIRLQGTLSNMIEKGFPSFDMKGGFSRSKKVKRNKDGGWKLVIPIRHSTPGAFMYGKAMPEDIYAQARKLKGNKSLSIPGEGAKSWTGYQHTAPIHHGMKRSMQPTKNGGKQSVYTTFRTASSNSNPDSWKHPGYSGVKISDNLGSFAEKTFVQNFNRALSNL